MKIPSKNIYFGRIFPRRGGGYTLSRKIIYFAQKMKIVPNVLNHGGGINKKQAGAELCQAQYKPELAKFWLGSLASLKFDCLVQPGVVVIVNNQTKAARTDVAWTDVEWTNVARTNVTWTNGTGPLVNSQGWIH